jgi:hypothetical protein
MALMTHATLDEAAAVAGISPSTARRWYATDEVKAELRRRQEEAVSHSLSRLKSCMTEALDVLRCVMADAGYPPSSRVAAARAVLDNAFRAVEADNILERIEALEKQMKEARS